MKGFAFWGFALAAVGDWLEARFPEFSTESFYRFLFPAGSLDTRGTFTRGKYCGIAVSVGVKRQIKRYSICDDLEPLPEITKTNDFVVVSPVSYAGKAMSQEHARELYALTFDLDGLLVKDGRQIGLENLFAAIDRGELEMPRPTFVVSSGTGVHLYWCLDKPIRLFPNVTKALWKFRVSLTRAIWQPDVTSLAANPQFESVTQSFRAVGSVAKDKKTRVRAFKTGERISLGTIKTITDKFPELAIPDGYESLSGLTLEEAKEKWPDWYQRRVVAGQPKGTWQCNRALYDWWKREIEDGANRFLSKDRGAQVGHRYWSIVALAVYARKCGIPREELEADALSLVDLLDSRTTSEDNHFDESDVLKALEAYDAKYITVPRRSIEQLTNIEIPPNKRNGRKQEVHLAICRSTKAILSQAGEGNSHNAGRPDKKALVADWYRKHPNTTISECSKVLGIARSTAQKWLHELRQ